VSRIVFVAPHLASRFAPTTREPDSPLAAFRRASFTEDRAMDWSHWLAAHFGLAKLPAAALAALPGEASTSVEPRGNKPRARSGDKGGHLLIAEPTHLAVRNDGLVFSPIAPKSLTAHEAATLVATLNHHFVADGLRFCVLSPQRWLVIADKPVDAVFVPAPLMPNASVFENVPLGADAKHYRRVMTEAQMLFHEHVVNQSRETRREMLVNSVWLWGEGALPPSPGPKYSLVVGDDPIAAGLALWMGASWSPRWPQKLPAGDVLALTALGDDSGEDLLAPAIQAVASGERAQLDLVLPTLASTRVWQLATVDRYKFWRNAPLPAAELA
jgi:hypothetical protein